jgi:hypothetical protein
MVRRSKRSDPEQLREQLVNLLINFRDELKKPEIRSKVIALIPAYHILRDLGSSLIPESDANSARDRILYYLLKYPQRIIKGEELMVVAGIGEWARRVRELRVEFGWSIATGCTIKEMAEEDEFESSEITLSDLNPDDYVLLSEFQDRDSAYRWNVANQIRKKKDLSVRDKILDFLLANLGKPVTGEELRYVANDRTEWARRVRELRTEYGWLVTTKFTGRPELSVGSYVLENDKQLPTHDRKIDDKVRRTVLMRDNHTCQQSDCKWNHSMWIPSDPRHLELHHIKPHAQKGKNVEENLVTLCNVCHDYIHRNTK